MKILRNLSEEETRSLEAQMKPQHSPSKTSEESEKLWTQPTEKELRLVWQEAQSYLTKSTASHSKTPANVLAMTCRLQAREIKRLKDLLWNKEQDIKKLIRQTQ